MEHIGSIRSLGHFARGRIRPSAASRNSPSASITSTAHSDSMGYPSERLKHGARLSEDVSVCIRVLDLDADT